MRTLLLPCMQQEAETPLPSYRTTGAAGLDLAAKDSVTIPAGARLLIWTGFTPAIPEGYEGQVRGRSSLSREGIDVILGTIDSDYRGEIAVLVANHSGYPRRIEQHQRIAQLVIAPVARVELDVRDSLTATARGAGGFGSTGA